MTDQERLTDFICSEKKMSANYDAFASECVNAALRDTVLNLFQQSHQTQTELLIEAQKKGWYQVEQAPDSKVRQAYQKFAGEKP